MPKVWKREKKVRKDVRRSAENSEGLSRRGLLKRTAGAMLGAAAVSITGALDARAQTQGLYTGMLRPRSPCPWGR